MAPCFRVWYMYLAAPFGACGATSSAVDVTLRKARLGVRQVGANFFLVHHGTCWSDKTLWWRDGTSRVEWQPKRTRNTVRTMGGESDLKTGVASGAWAMLGRSASKEVPGPPSPPFVCGFQTLSENGGDIDARQ